MAAVAFAAAVILAVTGCSGSSETSVVENTTTTTTTTVPPTTTTTTLPPSTTTDPAILGAELFVDPQGFYEILVDPAWVASHGEVVAEVEGWFVAEPEAGFTANVIVLTQPGGPDMESFIELNVPS